MENRLKINLQMLIYDFSFVIIGYICMVTYNKHNLYHNVVSSPMALMYTVIAVIIIVYLYPLRANDEKHAYLYENKKALILFIVIETLRQTISFVLTKVFGINNANNTNIKMINVLLIYLVITSTIFICYFFKIRLKEFNWKLSIKSFTLVIIIYIAYRLLMHKGAINIHSFFNINYIFNFSINAIVNTVYPGFCEEVLFRGFLISGLKGLGIRDNTCNIVQAIIFGISHVAAWGSASWIFLLSTAAQAMIGYILGKIYFKTKSLLPCILLHGLFNTM